MAISRRAFGLGLFGLAAAGTGGYLAVKDNPALNGAMGRTETLSGFVGGEKQSFLADPEVVKALRGFGLEVDARVAGSVEMVREPKLLEQKPQFLWPSSSVMVDIARGNGVVIRNDQVVLNSPIVVYSWTPVVEGLIDAGLVTVTPEGHHQLDLEAFIVAVLEAKRWADLGVEQLYGRARIVSTDPERSNSGFMFAGLALGLLNGDVASLADLDRVGPRVVEMFKGMGFKSPSSGKLFDQYIAGGVGQEPMIVGYENQLVEWILANPERWERVSGGTGSRPVILYPKPTVYSAHPLIATGDAALPLIDALMSPKLQELAWSRHGFRGPLGTPTGSAGAIDGLLPDAIEQVMPMPDADVMLELLNRLED